MNLALPAVILILGILPGIIFFNSYFSGRLPKALSGVSPTSELALWFLFAIPLNLAVGIPLVRFLGLEVSYDVLAALVTTPSSPSTTVLLSQTLRATGIHGATVYVIFLVTCLFIGNIFRRIVWAFRLDVAVPFLRLKHEWYYALTARVSGVPRGAVPHADLLVDHPEGSRLYRGYIQALEVGADGDLAHVTLAEAQRGKGRGSSFEWAPIPGSRFLLRGVCIHSVNLHYVVLQDPKLDATRWQKGIGWCHVLLESFLWQRD